MLLKRFTEAIMELDGSPDFSRIMFVCRLVDECPMILIQITTSKQYKYSTYTPVRIRFHRLSIALIHQSEYDFIDYAPSVCGDVIATRLQRRVI